MGCVADPAQTVLFKVGLHFLDLRGQHLILGLEGEQLLIGFVGVLSKRFKKDDLSSEFIDL